VNFDDFEALTFDCYGTLIDWETGILSALHPVLERAGLSVDHESLLERFARIESSIQRGPYRPYRQVLTGVLRGLGSELGFRATQAEEQAFAASVGTWPTFPDTVDALTVLRDRYRLAVVSNVDDDLFEGSATLIDVPFDKVVTAQQVRSYKPARTHFDEVLRRLEKPMDRVLHVAQSLFHDIAPAKALGFSCVWVNRRAGKPGGGATFPADAKPDLEVPDLASLVEHMGLGA
jgi:2-haloacid dehalogenase